MKIKIFYLAIAALLVLGLSSRAFCRVNKPHASKGSINKEAEPVQKVSGKVSGYSWSNSTITIAPVSGASVTIEIDKSTKISKSGKAIKMTEIKTGDVVNVDYEIKGGKRIAAAIAVQEKTPVKTAIPEKKKR